MSGRETWIDAAKGIGILAVVLGHVYLSDTSLFVNWFHMPLFFYLSGYLHKSDENLPHYFGSKFRRLMIPYFVFLAALSLPKFIQLTIGVVDGFTTAEFKKLAYFGYERIKGGYELQGWFSVFWFISCLFLTQQLYNFIDVRFRHNVRAVAGAAAALYVFAYLNTFYFQKFHPPFSANVCALAFVFYFLGHMSRVRPIRIHPALPLGVLVLAVVLNEAYGVDLYFGMKYARYGIPVFSTLINLSAIYVVCEFSRRMSATLVAKGLIALGQTSLVIMYVHQCIQMSMAKAQALDDPLLRVAVSVAAGYLLSRLLEKSEFTKRYFLGTAK